MFKFLKDIFLEEYLLLNNVKEIKSYKSFVFPDKVEYLFLKNNLPILVLECIDLENNDPDGLKEILLEKTAIYQYCLENNIDYCLLKTTDVETVEKEYAKLNESNNDYINSFKNKHWKLFNEILYKYNLNKHIPLSKTKKAKLTTKQVIVIRKDLMNPYEEYVGKMIAQGSHAALGVVLSLMSNGFPLYDEIPRLKEDGSYDLILNVKLGSDIDKWLRGIFTKVVVYVNSEEELLEVYNRVKNKNIPCLLIEDNGLTKFNNQKTLTALAIGPYNAFDLNKITRDLPLL